MAKKKKNSAAKLARRVRKNPVESTASKPLTPAIPSSTDAVAGELVPRKEKKQPHPIEAAISTFLSAMDDHRDAIRLGLPAVAKDQMKRGKALQKSLQKKLKDLPSTSDEEGIRKFIVSDIHMASALLAQTREHKQFVESKPLEAISRSLFIGLFTAFDAYTGILLYALYTAKSDLLRSIKREISLADLLAFTTLDAVTGDMLDKEIDSFRRLSYGEQFQQLETKFEINTLRQFPEWPRFIELAQRRNLLTHNGGVVSQQYINVCEKEGYKFTAVPKLKDVLRVDTRYLIDAVFLIRKVGFMLGYTLWRKVLPKESERTHDHLNVMIFELLKERRWQTAAEYGEFALQAPMMRGASDIVRRIRIVNVAIAKKQLGDAAKAKALLEAEDWSAATREFKLAIAVLNDRYVEAADIMLAIGKQGELVTRLAYHDWPLFADFRGSKEFQDAYESVYGYPFLQKVAEDVTKTSDEVERKLAEP